MMRYLNIFISHSDYINNSGVTCRITQPPAAPRGATSVAAGPQDEARGHPVQAMQEAVGDSGVGGNGESVTSVPGAAGACWSHRKIDGSREDSTRNSAGRARLNKNIFLKYNMMVLHGVTGCASRKSWFAELLFFIILSLLRPLMSIAVLFRISFWALSV